MSLRNPATKLQYERQCVTDKRADTQMNGREGSDIDPHI